MGKDEKKKGSSTLIWRPLQRPAIQAGSDPGVLRVELQYGGLGAADLSLENISAWMPRIQRYKVYIVRKRKGDAM